MKCNWFSILCYFQIYSKVIWLYMYTYIGEGNGTPLGLLPGKSHGWRSLEGCSPWGCWGSDTTERLHFPFPLSCIGEGNGNPLQCSCLENLRDGRAWWAAVYGVVQSQIRLKRLSSSSSTHIYSWSESDTLALVTQLCQPLCDPMDCNPPGSSVHGILQARILEWVTILFSRGSSWKMLDLLYEANSLPSELSEKSLISFPLQCIARHCI